MGILRLNRRFRFIIAGVAGVIMVALLVIIIRALIPSRALSLQRMAEEIPLSQTKEIEPFGDGFVLYDGIALRSYDVNGKFQWEYKPSTSGEFQFIAQSQRIAIWSDLTLTLLASDGDLTFSGPMKEAIASARCGHNLTALRFENADESTDGILVIDGSGVTVDNISFSQGSILDYGFYSQNDLLWVLTLDVSGSVPQSALSTYQPGKLSTGGYSFSDQIVYKALFYQEQIFMIGTRELTFTSTSSSTTQPSPLVIYGWKYNTSTVLRNGLTILFTLASQENTTLTALRVVQGSDVTNLHIPPGSLSLYAGSSMIYSIGTGMVYALPYGGGGTQSYALPDPIDSVIAQLTNDRVLVSSGGMVYMLTLPK